MEKYLYFISEVEIVVYLRKPSDFYLSYLQQSFKSANRIVRPTMLKYGNSLQNWEMFGELKPRLFAKDALVQGDIIADYFKHYLPDVYKSPKLTHYTQNETISAEGMQILLEYQKVSYEKGKPKNQTRTRKLLSEIKKAERKKGKFDYYTKPKLHQRVSTVIDSDNEDAHYIYDKYGVDLGTLDLDKSNYRMQKFTDLEQLITVDQEKVKEINFSIMNKLIEAVD
ncbi:hypothetical protein [Flexibacterium corallicola]|uniref:hypothetical protein n=1 Tax=Flexibacterium corallicola TaxID=3037259 RepID=UPI00286EF3A1|nr:hypothetical protein [Pseudovibrio sp. M1P-2-3]